MPPFYPDQYQDQYPDQYSYEPNYDDQYHQYQYQQSSQPQSIPPYSQIQVSVPPPRHQQPPPQTQSSYNFPNFQPSYLPPSPQFQYHYQPQQQFPQQYQQAIPAQAQLQSQPYYQPMPQYAPPPQQIQVNIPKPQPPSQPQIQSQRVLKDVQPTAPRQQPVISKLPPSKVEPDLPEPDYDILLLSLADEYLEAAEKLPYRSDDYFKLTSTALGCIDAVLNNFKLQPLREAQVSLRYAQLLLNETENYDDAERTLTKTIDMCERLKYHDLKYGAQLLLIRTLYQSRPKAALKDLQAMVQDIEAYKHIAWEYAFRLQYVLFLASSNQPSDNHAAIAQLERIGHVARQSSDYTVFAFAAVLESLIHLQSASAESFQASQRSLAKARALQLNRKMEEIPQISLLMEFVDLCGQIKQVNTDQSAEKRKDMQAVLYAALQNSSWRADGLMYLPINPSSLRGLQTQDSGLIADRNGKYFLALSWLHKDEVEDLGYLLSGISAVHKNAGDGGKAEKFFEEGLSLAKEILEEKRPTNRSGDNLTIRQLLVKCHHLLELAFLQCSKGQWQKAQALTKSIERVAEKLENQFPIDLRCLTDYVKGSIHQGRGELDAALAIFESPSLNILSQHDGQTTVKTSSQLHRRDDTIRSASILSAMNTIFIVQQKGHPQHQRLPGLISAIDPLASEHPNRNIKAAWNFVLASLPNSTILKTKQYLGTALNIAQSISNAQITTLCLVSMQEKFFKGVVGEQAIKCAKAASHQAKRLNEPLWIATASGLEAECLGVHGRAEESAKKREETERVMTVLPEKVKNSTIGS